MRRGLSRGMRSNSGAVLDSGAQVSHGVTGAAAAACRLPSAPPRPLPSSRATLPVISPCSSRSVPLSLIVGQVCRAHRESDGRWRCFGGTAHGARALTPHCVTTALLVVFRVQHAHMFLDHHEGIDRSGFPHSSGLWALALYGR